MRKRDRLKNRIKRMMSGGADAQAVPPAASPPPTSPPVQAAPPPTPAPAEPAPVPAKVAEAPVDPEAEEKAKKAAKHVERTRKAMLKFVIEQGGEASMADMHELSERRYFIGHKRFSDLMEGLVGEGLIAARQLGPVGSAADRGSARARPHRKDGNGLE